MIKPLQDITVLDFTQFLSGPSASLRLSDLGARVIKVEHKEKGDLSRSIYASHLNIAGQSGFYQGINRGKECLALNLKDADDLALVKQILPHVDIVLHNFRPDVMQRLGLSPQELKRINPKVIYGEITGYGHEGPWRDRPGQDLLLQALSGLAGLSGDEASGPVPMGLAIVDNLAGAQLVQGVLAALYAGEGALVQVSMLEAALDFQFEPLTLYYHDGEAVNRGTDNAAHALVGAPYGLYKTSDGHLALAMGSITFLGELLACAPLLAFADPARWFAERDAIKAILATHLEQQSTAHWLSILEPADIWCAEVLNWQQLVAHEGFQLLHMVQEVSSAGGSYLTTRCPIRIDDQLLTQPQGAPSLGEHNHLLRAEFLAPNS
ncbi:CaiB/BaiF CoA transferase family protein [Gilvimarinus polysaccharolyticus]|uniref:CaiB/BaiF CoA transferase family protein n=1 Tax=Gilvimarinus polysaccharolyticus TaxID=863921 RepID=UPI0009FF1E8C|nr:CoA transferase [Gilvimarinus polysaccharolyticus]